MISCTFNYIENDFNNLCYVLFINVFGFVVPMMLAVHSFYGILRINRESVSTLLELTEDVKQINCFKKRETTLAKNLCATIFCFGIAWTPYAVVALCSLSGQEVSKYVSTGCALFAKASTCFNCMVYISRHPELPTRMMRGLRGSETNHGIRYFLTTAYYEISKSSNSTTNTDV
ncbi:compound eye opsin BCRH2-like [Ciona intestinalis]